MKYLVLPSFVFIDKWCIIINLGPPLSEPMGVLTYRVGRKLHYTIVPYVSTWNCVLDCPDTFIFRTTPLIADRIIVMWCFNLWQFVLEDDRLNQSEALYTFLSPSSAHLKQVSPSPKKSKFSLSTLFKR
jgi:hypothetical protein